MNVYLTVCVCHNNDHKTGAMHLCILYNYSFYHKTGAMHLECKYHIESLS